MGWNEFWSGVGENLSNIFGGSAGARRNAENQLKDYRNAINQYTGSEGYKNALNTAAKETARLAGQQANQAAAQQQSALRSSGQSGNAAAILAGNNASTAYQNAYNNNIQGQQSAAYNAGTDRVNAESAYNKDRLSTAEANQQQSGNTMQKILSGASSVASAVGLGSADDFFKKYRPRKMESLKVELKG